MILTETLKQFDANHLFFCDPIRNNVMNNSYFIRLLYSNALFTLNGVYLQVPFEVFRLERCYNKFLCFIHSTLQSETIIQTLNHIEADILARYQKSTHVPTTKTPLYHIRDQLKCGHIKTFSDSEMPVRGLNTFVLKIAGVWETDTEYGLTYKFSCE